MLSLTRLTKTPHGGCCWKAVKNSCNSFGVYVLDCSTVFPSTHLSPFNCTRGRTWGVAGSPSNPNSISESEEVLQLLPSHSSGSQGGPHSLHFFHTGVSEPSPGLPAFVAVGYVDGETISRYDSETQRKVPRTGWMKANVEQQYWDRQTETCQNRQQIFFMNLDMAQKRYNHSGGYHTWQSMYGCDLLEDGGIWGFYQEAYNGRDFLTLDKDMLTFTAADAAAEITKREREAAGEPERWKHYLENTCVEWLRKYVEYGKATLERRERPTVRVSGKESHGLLTLSCRAHGFYPRSIAINWLRKGRVQAQETKWGSTVPNSDGTYHAWASIEAFATEKDEYQCRVEHASLPEPGLFSWGERGRPEVAECRLGGSSVPLHRCIDNLLEG
uniref:Ig-like domain-containing protein n=1 Tax=Apteryx owenii TaxID=8824 RepID=A0A8B9QRH1_APTOW